MFLKGFIPLQLLILQLFWLRVCEEAYEWMHDTFRKIDEQVRGEPRGGDSGAEVNNQPTIIRGKPGD